MNSYVFEYNLLNTEDRILYHRLQDKFDARLINRVITRVRKQIIELLDEDKYIEAKVYFLILITSAIKNKKGIDFFMDNSKYILNEISKGLQMGMDSISNITPKIGDKNFKDDLLYQYNEYRNLLHRVNDEISNYSDVPEQLNPMQKAMGWMGVEMNTLTDKSNSKISEMMLQGTNMGIIEGVKLWNNNPDATEPVKNILKDFITFQENTVEKLKKYL